MTEATGGQPLPGNILPPIHNGEILRARTLEAVRTLDPELLEHPDARPLVEMGAEFIGEATEQYGTPDHPLWHEGTVESRPMTYHNGGEDGHTSAGEQGIGVPRGTLLINGAINRAAGREVVAPVARARNFYSGSVHDRDQNCGRALLPEGQQGEGYGDERLSAEAARDRLLAANDEAGAEQTYLEVMATAFDPNTKAQRISYDTLDADPDNPAVQQSILGQEVVAAADLLSPTSVRGTLGAIENVLEALASNASNRALQQVLATRGVRTTGVADVGQLLDVIGADEGLRTQFANAMDGQAKFFSGFQYSDRMIRTVTGGQGIDDLFPGRAENATVLAGFAEALRDGSATPRQVWEQARVRAGYESDSAESLPNGMPAMVGGIPGEYFNPSTGDGRLRTPNGHEFLYSFSPDNIWLSSRLVWDHRYYDYPHFSANVSDYQGQPCMAFSVRRSVTDERVLTELGMSPDAPRHEDIDPRALVDTAITYFEQGGQQLAYLRGSWEEGAGSVNYERFISNLRSQGVTDYRHATQEQMRLATAGTWTEAVAKSHGFDDAAKVEWVQGSERPMVYVYFKRPE